jgi:hypothetical protein
MNDATQQRHFCLKSLFSGTVDQFRDKTERFMHSAKERAIDAIHDDAPRLTSLERGYWLAEKRRRQRENDIRKAAS